MVLVSAWAAAVAWTLLTAREDLVGARDDLRRLRDGADMAELLEPEATAELADVAGRLASAADRLASPVLAPVRVLPVVGRQVRSAAAIAEAAARSTATATAVVVDVDQALTEARAPDTDRVAMLRDLSGIARGARDRLATVELGPDEALVDQLRQAREELAGELGGLIELLDTVDIAASGLAHVLDGPGCHLLLAANNAEMRAGSGMFLQAGELCFDDGRMSLGELVETSSLQLPPDAVAIQDRDLRERWGFLLPNAEWRNLALSPRFPASAALAADMWAAATGRTVDGVIAVDPVALEVLLEATGPVDVDGQRYRAADVVDELLVEQYEGFLDPGYDADARKQRLGRVAAEVVTAFDSGGWSTETLVGRLPSAAAGRHILLWSEDERLQQAWEAMGVAGRLEPRSLAVNVLNRGGGRGGGKLDPFLRVDATVEAEGREAGSREVVVTVELHNAVPPGTPTYAENPHAADVRFGVYEGILTLNAPGPASDVRIDDEQLIAAGADGPTVLVATRFELGPSERRTFTTRFSLPSEVEELRIEPSARVPPVRWTVSGDQRFADGRRRTVAF